MTQTRRSFRSGLIALAAVAALSAVPMASAATQRIRSCWTALSGAAAASTGTGATNRARAIQSGFK